MKKYLWCLPIFGLLAGCGASGPIDVGDLAVAATDRIGAEVQIRIKDADTRVEIAKIYQEEAKARQEEAKAKQKVVLTISDPQSMALYQLGQANERLADSNKIMGEAIISMSSGKGKYEYIAETPEYRKGAFAEGFDSFFGGVATVANSAGGQLISGGVAGKMIGSEVRKAGATGSTTFNGDATVTGSFNSSTSHITGSTSSTSAIQPYEVTQPDPTVVHADVVEVGGE